MMTHYSDELSKVYDSAEANSITNLVFCDFLEVNKAQLLLRKEDALSESEILKLIAILKRLKTNEPVQYILGYQEFYGFNLQVNSNVLIPRPETEELVDMIIKENANPSRILDIGTGSGCIPLALKLHFKNAEVTGYDISTEALELAKSNAKENKLRVQFEHVNILDSESIPEFDVIVSNPPYVLNSRKEHLDANVVKFEPHVALFVKDNDPLIFFRKILSLSIPSLQNGGRLYFEINENLGQETIQLKDDYPNLKGELRKDLSGHHRFVLFHF